MASATSRSAWCCASGEAVANCRVGTSLMLSRITPRFAGAQLGGAIIRIQTDVSEGRMLFFRSDGSLRKIGRVAHHWEQLLNLAAVRCKKLHIRGVDAAQSLFERRRGEVGEWLPVFTCGNRWPRILQGGFYGLRDAAVRPAVDFH